MATSHLVSGPTVDRSTLDALLAQAYAAHTKRDEVEACTSPAWLALHREASSLYRQANEERRRLWKLDRWGRWMNATDRQLATISGEI